MATGEECPPPLKGWRLGDEEISEPVAGEHVGPLQRRWFSVIVSESPLHQEMKEKRSLEERKGFADN